MTLAGIKWQWMNDYVQDMGYELTSIHLDIIACWSSWLERRAINEEIMSSILLRAPVILSLFEILIWFYRFIFTRNKCRYGRKVKATDSQSVSILKRRFESFYLRNSIFKEMKSIWI